MCEGVEENSMNNFISAKQKKDRGMSVDEAIKLSLKNEFTDVVIIGMRDNGEVETIVSTDNDGMMVGLMEISKVSLIDDM